MAIIATSQITLIDMNDARSLATYIGSNSPKVQIYDPVTTVSNPNWATNNVVLTPELYVSGDPTNIIANAKSITWFEDATQITSGTNGYTIGASGAKALTIAQNKLSDGAPIITYTCKIVWTDTRIGVDLNIESKIEFSRIKNGQTGGAGQNAVVAVLSNEAHAVAADSAGANQVITGATSTVTVYEGTTDVTSSWNMGTPVVSGLGALNTGYSLSGSPTNRTVTLLANGMTADVATVTWTLTRSGYANITKVFTLTRVKAGAAATSPTAYWLITDVSAIQKDLAGVYTPSNLKFSAKSQTGSGSPADYSTKFIIADSTDGSTFTDRYSSASNETGYPKTYPASGTFNAGIKAVRVRLYKAGDTPSGSNYIDEQVIPVVFDGAKGVNSITAYVYAPNGNVVKNATGSVTAKCMIFDGVTEITAGTTYLWYKLISGVWTALTAAYTGYNTNTLTIPATAVESTASFKCIVSYGGKSYEDVVTIADQSDPIAVVPIAAEGNVFRNSTGADKTITAKVYQAGVEIDAGGTIYEYRWFLRDSAGVASATFVDSGKTYKTGKTIAVPHTEVTGLGNLVIELHKV